MAGSYHFLSDEEVKLIQWTIDEARKRTVEAAPGDEPIDDTVAPETYVALTPATGIYGLVAAGTGSTPCGSYDTPASASCTIYQLVDGHLIPAFSGVTKTVYNLSGNAIAGFTWVLVQRDKFGKWFAIPYLPASSVTTLVGKCDYSGTMGQMADVSIWTSGSGIGTGTGPTTDTGVVNSDGDLVHSGHKVSALFLLGPPVAGAWVILITWQYGWLAVNMECQTVAGTGT